MEKYDFEGVKLRKVEKFFVNFEWKFLRKENICVNSNEYNIMSKKSFGFGGFLVKYFVDDKKLFFFRIGKYIFKDDVYFCGNCEFNEKLLVLFGKFKESLIEKIVFGLSLLFLFRIGKYILNDNFIYVKSLEKLEILFSFFFYGLLIYRVRRLFLEKIVGK